MIETINFEIPEFKLMKKYPNELFYIGNSSLLQKRKISIVGSRTPNQYSRTLVHELVSKLTKAGICIVSGGAIGIDTIAHKASNINNTIMVAGTGLDKKYPSINKKMIENIEEKGLVLSQFKIGTPSTRYNFPLRNELLVALGEVLIVAYADLNSGTQRSIEYALKMKKRIFVFPHRIGESEGTNELLRKGKAKAIFDIDIFIKEFTKSTENDNLIDPILLYCQSNPIYEDAISKFGDKIFEYELNNIITISNGRIYPNY